MNHRLRRSHVRYAAPVAPAHVTTHDRLQRRRLMTAPFAPVPDVPGTSAARGITFGTPFALALWALVAWSVAPALLPVG